LLRGPPSGYRGSFQQVKMPRIEDDYLPLSSAEIKSVWSLTSTPPICLPGMDKNKFTFYLYMKETGREDFYPAYVSRGLVTSCCGYGYELWVQYNAGNFSNSFSSVAFTRKLCPKEVRKLAS